MPVALSGFLIQKMQFKFGTISEDYYKTFLCQHQIKNQQPPKTQKPNPTSGGGKDTNNGGAPSKKSTSGGKGTTSGSRGTRGN